MQNGSQDTRHLGQILALQLDIQVTASTSTNLDMTCHRTHLAITRLPSSQKQQYCYQLNQIEGFSVSCNRSVQRN